MSNENRILLHLFHHNAWATEQMLDACAGLTDVQLGTELPGTYGRLDHTLVHLARSQLGYVMRLTNWQPGPEWEITYEELFPGVERVREHLRSTGERLVELAREADADRVLEFEYEAQPQRIAAWVVLLQAAFHATEHRQQVATILTHLGVEPPEPDLWHFWDAHEAGDPLATG